ncbi:MAG: response regulator [Candidatus Omnitrophica bacterium]|nr:response regulator [Candidatus Omnitrophota bacterium]
MSKRRIKLLVVDDVQSIREFVQYYFKERGYVVLMAASAEEALPIIKEEYPDIMLLDMNLTGMSGLELLKLVRQFNTEIKVIMLSGSNIDFKSDPRFKELNILDFIHKPSGLTELELAVEKAIKHLKTRRQDGIP